MPVDELDRLVERAKAGDKRAEEKLFDYLYVRFETFATLKVGEGASHDIAVEACEIILRKYKSTEFTKGFDAWAYGVLKNVLRNHYRSSRTMERVMVPENNPERKREFSTEPDQEQRLAVIDCLAKIIEVHPRYGRALELAMQGYRALEISEQLKVKRSHLYVMLNRGRVMLKKCLDTGEV